MKAPYVKWAMIVAVLVLGQHFLFQNVFDTFSKNVDVDKVKSLISRFTAQKQSATISSMDDEIIVPLTWDGIWAARVELNDLYDANLAIDTGATVTSLSEELAFDMGLSPKPGTQPIRMETANGTTQAWVGQVRSVRLGEAQVNDMVVAVLDFSNLSKKEFDGLLGLNFLNQFVWHLDQQNGQLILRPR